MYNAGTGLFTSGDPLWGAQLGNSAYHYGYNSPLLFSDPTGLLAQSMYQKGTLYLTAATAQALEMSEYWENHPFGGGEYEESQLKTGVPDGSGGGGGSDKETTTVTIRETEDDPGIKYDIHPQVLAAIQAGFKIYPTTYGGGLEPTDLLFDIMPSNLSRKTIIGFFAGFAKAVSSKVAAKGMVKEGVHLTKAQLKSIASLELQITEHQTKLSEYIKNPMKFDNKGFLQNAPNDEVRQKIIQSRINHLNHEIQVFKNNIHKIRYGK